MRDREPGGDPLRILEEDGDGSRCSASVEGFTSSRSSSESEEGKNRSGSLFCLAIAGEGEGEGENCIAKSHRRWVIYLGSVPSESDVP